ncbi:MAG: HEAT repeat domain-containing protein [Candidatus Lokiarchaeota archaeon]|nr:HEAT repeat domain-containing protein [Candidatus Lokiarchaeota archaeon]
MKNKQSTIEQKISALINELVESTTQNPKDNSKIDSILDKLHTINTWQIIDPIKSVLDIPEYPIRVKQDLLALVGKVQDPRAVSLLGSYLESSNPKLRNMAIKTLSFIKNPKVTSYLLNVVTNEEDKWTKIFAIHGLTKNTSPKVVQPLVQLLGDTEEEVRKEAINALNKIKLDIVDDILIDALNSQNRYIQLGSVSLLGMRRVKKSTQSLIELLGNEDLRLNLLTCNSLSQISDSESIKSLLEYASNEETNTNPYILCIQKMDKKIIPSLIDLYTQAKDDQLISLIEYILSKRGFETHEEIINRKLHEKDLEVKEKLQNLLNRIDITSKKQE